ncbi:MAG: FGGY family carbohydrate kinase [Desulfotignum sp.]|nr:FGGY family carbohydrate kinase [Desulfotignum sp.]
MRDRYILAVDCGTQSLRAMIFDLDGEMLARVKECYPPCISPGPGRAEQDPDIYWQSLKTACRKLKQTAPQFFDTISGIGVTMLRNTLVNLDRQGRVLRPAITWMDQRRADPGSGRTGVLRLGYMIPVLGNILKENHALGKCKMCMNGIMYTGQ